VLTVAEAQAAILAAAKKTDKVETVSLLQAKGRVLAENIEATVAVPPCDNSAMDGYAVYAADCESAKILPVAGVVYAGAVPGSLQAGTAQRIFTGAPVPAGADAVIIQEDVCREENAIALNAACSVKAGDNIRRAGEDIAVGDVLFRAGHCLRAVDIGLLASVGIQHVRVTAMLRVGLLCTGDELLEPGQPAQAGKIYNSNRYLLTAMLQDLGWEIVDAGIVKDDLQATTDALQRLANEYDVIISTGGVSVGDADYVKQAVQQSGQLEVWKIAVKPGKPLAFGRVGQIPFFGLPGNPVSAFVTFMLFVRPYLQSMQGSQPRELRRCPVQAGFDWPRPGKREEYLRVALRYESNALVAVALPNQGSGVLSSVCRADALLRVPVNTIFAVGDTMECLLLD